MLKKELLTPTLISEAVIISEEVRERIKETVGKTCERQERTRKKKNNQKKRRWEW